MTTFTFRFVATTGETFEYSVEASTINVARIKMVRARKAQFGTDKIWMAI